MEHTPSQPSSRLPRNVIVLGWASLLNDIASEMVFPLLSKFITEVLKASKLQLGLIEGLADMAASFLRLFAGGWSDALGQRRGFIVCGYTIAAAMRPLTGLATMPWHVLLARTGDRFGKGVRSAPRDALIAESISTEQRGRAFGFHQAMDHLGATVGPMLAALFLFFLPGEYRWLFLITLIPGLLAVSILVFGLKPQPVIKKDTVSFRLSLKPFQSRFKKYLIALALFTLGCSSDAFLLIRASDVGVPVWQLPILWGLFSACKSLGNYYMGWMVDRYGAPRFICFGWIVYGCIYVGFGLLNAPWQVWGIMVLYALFYALTEPAEKTMVAHLALPEWKGLAFGWFHFTLGLTILPANLLFGWVYDRFGPMAAFTLNAGFAFVAAMLFAFWVMQPAINATTIHPKSES